ncbi:MAG TPA: hypothetical protein PK528_06300 [Syntrophorhabdus sp.]|jgi:hypothetical protein|nr:hypothetical protein [Syntrophorhabdus sp.]HQO63206.1 hypothetical protein [Syntrophorhabdus sp.]
MRKLSTITFLFVFLPVLLCSCDSGSSSGDGGTPQSENVTKGISSNGIWEGTFTELGYGTFDAIGLLYNGRIIAISESAGIIYDGSYSMNGDKMTGTVTSYEIGGGLLATANMSATITERSQITGTFSTSYGSNGSMSLTYSSLYERDSSLDLVAGSWASNDYGYSIFVSVGSNGVFSGLDTDGGRMSGNISVLEPGSNIYGVTLNLSSSEELNGNYSGFAVLFDDDSANDSMIVVVSNSNYILFNFFSRG